MTTHYNQHLPLLAARELGGLRAVIGVLCARAFYRQPRITKRLTVRLLQKMTADNLMRLLFLTNGDAEYERLNRQVAEALVAGGAEFQQRQYDNPRV